jgi:hypothetical protein
LTGVLCGGLRSLSGRLTSVSYLVVLTVSLSLFTVWLLLASVVFWRRATEAVPAVESST